MFFVICSLPARAMGGPTAPPTLSTLQSAITGQLNMLDNEVAQAARQIGSLGLSSPGTADVLMQLYNNNSAIVDCVTVDSTGRIVLIEPEKYKYSEGTIISNQPHVIKMIKTKRPLLSQLFKTVEGFSAVVLAYPVFANNGDFIGSLSVVFKPDALIGQVARPLVGNYPASVTVLQTDGLILYDSSLLQIGKATFTDPAYQPYPSLLALAGRMVAEREGNGSYEFLAKGSREAVTKAAEWTTIGLHGTEWRLLLAQKAN